MNIIIFTHNYPISYSERRNAGIFVHDFVIELAKTNQVAVVCPASFNKKVKFGAVTVYFFSWAGKKHLGKLKFYNPVDLFYAFKLLLRGIQTLSTAVKEAKPDFSLAFWAIPGGALAYITKIKFRIPYAVWVLGSDFYVYSKIPVLGFFILHVLRSSRYIFADGISLAREVSDITRRKGIFLPSSTKFDSPLSKSLSNRNKRRIVLTFIGRMELIKGPDILLDAIIKLGPVYRNFKVNFLGDGSLLSILSKKAENNNLGDTVKFYGNVDSSKKIVNILGKTDWLVVPSRSDSIPLVFSEAMKVRVPVITASLTDLKYLVKKYKVGLYFKPGDAEELLGILRSLPKKMRDRKIFVKNTVNVAKLFSVEKSVGQLLKYIA